MENLIPLPNKIYFAKEEKFKSQVIIEPLYPGYGMTIGNALRRVLLSSLPGAAVTAVKIKGVDHEFSSIQNVTEDVVDIILNLKKLRLRMDAQEPVKLELRAKGQKEVYASDIKVDSRVEIINKDLLIATLDAKNTDFFMEIIVEPGRGYVPVEQRESEKLEIGMISVDAIFTPMRNVNFEVENVRVGKITNYDKLTITMETDGTTTGREAMDLASQILVDHFALLKTAEAGEEVPAPVKEAAPEEAELVIEEGAGVTAGDDLKALGLSNRAYNALVKNNATLQELKKMTREDLQKLEGLGAKSIDEILKVLETHEASE
jgi:DNA-directed RNA polymerase subunit alpha